MVLETIDYTVARVPIETEKANGNNARESKLIDVDRAQSVQVLPDTKGGEHPYTNSRWLVGTAYRGPLLPERGTRDRERALYQYYWNDYNTAFRAAIAGLIKRVMSTPWELIGPDDMVEFFQFVLQNADFGQGWETFIGKLILDYSRYDAGAYIELIGMGDPLEPLYGPVTGISVLDSRRCWPTGDPAFPVLYYDIYGGLHVMHHTRVVRFVDNLDPSEYAYGYGECALSRSISAVVRDILTNRYIEQRLDDNPPSGIMLFQNITSDQLYAARQQLKQKKQTDHGHSDIIELHGMQMELPVKVESIPFQQVPEKFDFQVYKQITMKELALGIGLDIQDLWELTGGNLGTATQSEILHQKSKGKALGRILKGLERVINLTLPDAVEFEFQYRDPDEDLQIAQRDTVVLQNATLALQSGGITQDEYRQVISNNVEMIREATTDQTGEIVRLDDQDPKHPSQLQPVEAPERETGQPTEQATGDVVRGETETKDYQQTQADFQRTFVRIAENAATTPTTQFSIEMALRAALQQAGEKVWLDGLQEGGVRNPVIDKDAQVAIAGWRTQQNSFITKFAKRLADKGLTPEQAVSKAQMWVNKSLNNLYYTAQANAAPNKMVMWIMNPIKEHCDSCLRLNGQIHPLKAFVKSGYTPQSEQLDCGGYKCGCGFVDAEGSRARGRLPTSGRGGLASLFGRIAGLFRSLLG